MEAHSSDPEICGLGCEVLEKVLALANRNHSNTFKISKITHNTILLKRSTERRLEERE